MIVFPCSACGWKLKVRDEFAGRNGTCPRCKQRVLIPAAAAPPGLEGTLDAARPKLAANPPSPVQAAPEGLDFLAPPQGPGELGRLGSYRVLKVIGAGSMGLVLLAEDSVLRRCVALKVLRPEMAAETDARQRFLREAQATAALEHPHIVSLYQVGEDRGVPFLAMPVLKGEPLQERLKRDKKLPIGEIISLGRQIAAGLAAAHEKGLIHRDIKPGNLWLEPHEGGSPPRSWVKIFDFGLARAITSGDGQLTKTGAILGTPAYMAPEQARSGKVDGRTDLFSLGGVLYRMLTGELPFKGKDPMAMLIALATQEPRPVAELRPDAPRALADLVKQLLSKDPERRPASARAVAETLAEMEGEQTHELPGPAAPAQAPRTKASAKRGQKAKPSQLHPVAGGVLLTLLVIGAIVFWRLLWADKPLLETPEIVPGADKVVLNSIGMKLMPIEPGVFKMGSPKTEAGRQDNELQHEVVLTRPFFMGVHEVTVGQFAAFVKETRHQTEAERTGAGSARPDIKRELDPAITWKTPGFAQTDEHPVVCVSWNDAAAFCDWLSKKEGKRYTLPTEAQWEYCCRAGSTSRFFFSANEANLGEYAWFDANSGKTTHSVGQKKPNAWGLYDMHGNVWQMTADWYSADYYKKSPKEDPPGPLEGAKVVLRGGSWDSPVAACRSAFRLVWATPSSRNTTQGFRVVRVW